MTALFCYWPSVLCIRPKCRICVWKSENRSNGPMTNGHPMCGSYSAHCVYRVWKIWRSRCTVIPSSVVYPPPSSRDTPTPVPRRVYEPSSKSTVNDHLMRSRDLSSDRIEIIDRVAPPNTGSNSNYSHPHSNKPAKTMPNTFTRNPMKAWTCVTHSKPCVEVKWMRCSRWANG
jgi:hypothetical protein